MPSLPRPAPLLLRLLLAVGVLVSGAASLADTPFQRTVGDLVAGVQRGDVRLVQRTDREAEPQALRMDATVGLDRPRDVEWIGRSGLRYRASVGDPEVDLLATLRAVAPPGQAPERVADGRLVRERLAAPLRGLNALLLVLLVFGPQPRRATKWGWFWLLLLPWGAGAGLLLAREAPWSPAACAEDEPFPKRAKRGVRASGGTGFGVLVAVSAAVLLLSAAVSALVPTPAPTGAYDVVLEDGTRTPGPLS